jgi:hypothetical protein
VDACRSEGSNQRLGFWFDDTFGWRIRPLRVRVADLRHAFIWRGEDEICAMLPLTLPAVDQVDHIYVMCSE